MEMPLEIARILTSNGIFINDERSRKLAEYVELLLQWNQKLNLISRRDSERIWESHILHSISPLFCIEFPAGTRMLDLGSGGGLPGIPLSIVHGSLEVALVDSVQKKTRALREILQTLQLPNVTVYSGRAEELAREPLKSAFDAVIARAVAPLCDLIRWSRPFLRKRIVPATRLKGTKGNSELSFPYLIALKGGDLAREIRDARLRARGTTITEVDLSFPGADLLGLVDKKILLVQWPEKQ